MRTLAIAALLIGCSTSHPLTTDRIDCIGCHTAPVAGDPVPAPCTLTDHTTNPTTCYQCHGTTAWCPADAKHSKWDLTTASHAGWDCADCHLAITYAPPKPAVTDPTMINCTGCHWHDQAQVDPHHIGNSKYTYGPATCLASGCHGGGRRQ